MGSKDIKEKSNKKRKSTHSKGKSEKEIYVVPGNINSKMSVGTNKLIKDGAKIITEFNDIIDEDY